MALAAAQSEMGKLTKGSENPHFRSKYADLADVVEAVQPALSAHGIAFFHILESSEFGNNMTTVLYHGASDTEIRCPVPLIIGKQDMQGFKSATTYAKRIGLESVTGVAPDDDDGNDAVKTGEPKTPKTRSFAKTVIDELPDTASETEKAEAVANALCAQWRRKKTPGELSNEYDRQVKLVESYRERFPEMHAKIIDAYENRMMEVTNNYEKAAE
jgi:hypothetical protein